MRASAPNPYGAAPMPARAIVMVGDIPIVVEPGPIIPVPAVPSSVPIAGPVLQFIGKGERAIWHDVWGWVSSTSKSAADVIIGAEQSIGQAVVNVVESYVGNQLQALSGFINQAFDFTASVGGDLFSYLIDTIPNIDTAINWLDGEVIDLARAVEGIDNIVIPGLEGEIRRLGIDTWDLVGGAVAGVETWAIDNIYDPVLRELVHVNDLIRTDVFDALARVLAQAEADIKSETAARAAAIAGLAAAVATITSWIDDCGEPMCQAMGPKTDLGKLLKGLNLALDAAAIAELATLTAPELEQRISQAITHLAGIVGQFEGYFADGTTTLGGIIAGAV